MMPEQPKAVATAKQSTTRRVELRSPADLFEHVQQLYDSIARRGFEIFESNERTFGHDPEDWFRAKSELLHPVHVDVAESDGNLTVRAEVPGFSNKELNISLEPRWLTSTGKRETEEEHKAQRRVFTEHCSDQILRVIDLPVTVDAEKASAELKDGVLAFMMPKAAPPKIIPVESKVA